MTREISSQRIVNGAPWFGTREDITLQVASESNPNIPVILVKLAFDSGDVNFHSRLGNIEWNGDTYAGVGRIAKITGIEETSDLARTPINMQLSGLPTDLLTVLTSEYYQGRAATVYHGYIDTTTYQLVADPIILYRGLMNKPTFNRGETAAINLSVESRFAQWDRPRERRYTNEDQRSRYPSDTFFQFMEQGVEKKIVWGAPTPG